MVGVEKPSVPERTNLRRSSQVISSVVNRSFWVTTLIVIANSSLGQGGVQEKYTDSIIDITSQVYVLKDENSNLRLDDIVRIQNRMQFEKNGNGRIDFGISESTVWLKFRLPDNADHFQLSSPNLHHIVVFKQDDYGNYSEATATGLLSAFGSREVDIDRFTFKAATGQWCYVKLRSGHFINTKVLAGTSFLFFEKSMGRMIFYSLYIGAMLIIGSYVLFFAIQDRKPYLTFYFGYLLFITSVNLTEKGFLHQYLWPQMPYINEMFPVLPFGVSIFLLFFIDELFAVRKKVPEFFRLVKFGVIAIPGATTLILVLVNRYHLAIIVTQVHSMLISGILIYFLFTAHTKSAKLRPHLLLLAIGILFFSASVVIYLLAENGILSVNFFTENAIIIGSFFEVLFSTSTIVLYQKSLRDRFQFLTVNQNALLRQNVEERTRELVSKNERLEDTMLEKENLVSIIAHDLKSPLNQTKALSQLVQREIGNSSEEAVKLAKHIEKVSNQGLHLIKELFETTIIEARQEKVVFTLINLRDLSQEIVERFIPISRTKQIDLHFSCSDQVMVNTYSPYVVRIFENALSNAIKFSPSGARVDISIQDLHSAAVVSIKDMGPGFREEDKKNMFKKFQKLSAKPTGGESSNGLGLYIIKTLASRVNAIITVDSECGKGTVFSFSFPKP